MWFFILKDLRAITHQRYEMLIGYCVDECDTFF